MLFSPDDPSPRSTLPDANSAEPFTHLISHLLAYKTWILGAATLGLALSGIALCFVTPKYKAEAVVIVDSRRNKLADAESAVSGIVIDQYMSALKSELDVMSSPDIARHVISSLDLLDTSEYASAKTHVPISWRFEALRDDLLRGMVSTLALVGMDNLVKSHPPAARPVSSAPNDAQDDTRDAVMQNAVRIFYKSFITVNDPKSLTIRLSYSSASPDLAAAVTNAVLRRYLAADEELKAVMAQRDLNWLKGRIMTLGADLATAEQAAEEFRASHDLATVGDRSVLQQVLLQLEQQNVDAQTQLSSAQAEVARDRDVGAANIADNPTVLGSVLIQNLRTQEATLVVERAKLLASSLPNDPQLVMVTSALAALRTTIATEVHRIAQANVANLQFAQMRLDDLSTRIANIQTKINMANAADIKLRSLEAQAASKREVLSKFAERYDQDAGTPLTPPDARVVSWASVPVDASSPHYGIDLAGGTLGFSFLAFCLSLAHERLRAGFGDVEELEAELGLVVAGLTVEPGRGRKAQRRQWLAGDPRPMRELAMTVRALAHTPGRTDASRVVLVTSAVAGEGKSTVALSLARNAASGGQRCLLIDADIRNPSLHATLGMPATPGLVELMLDHVPFRQVARRIAGESFDFISAGRPTPDTLGPFTLESFGRTLAELKQSYDVIVLDSAPILLASEVLVLVGCADMTLFLAKWRTTPRQIARKAAGLITRCSAGPCLAVLSQVDLRRMRVAGGRRMEAYYTNRYVMTGPKRGQ